MRVYTASRACVLSAAIMAALTLGGCGADKPASPQPDAGRLEQLTAAFVEALKPRRPGRPVIAILARNEDTETTDLLLPHAVLQRADVAEVLVVAPRRGRISLYPALQVDAEQDLASFDQSHPSGADYVIVPAMKAEDADIDPAIPKWLRQQADRGARIIGVCAGALVVGRAGLLDGRRFTTHWYYRKTALERHPTATYMPNQRYVVDRGVATTTGVTASVPAMLALIEAIGGPGKARALAAELGVDSWSPAHDSSRFGLTLRRAASYLLNKATFWRDEHWAVDVHDGMDDIALAFAADAWTRTGHVQIEAAAPRPVKLRSGLVLAAHPAAPGTLRMPLAAAIEPVAQLDRTLCEIGERFGAARREWVMMEIEYPESGAGCTPPLGTH